MTVVPHQSASAEQYLDDDYSNTPSDTFAGHPMPPCDIEAERVVLSSMMLSEQATTDCQNVLHAGDYYRPHHGTIHEVIVELRAKGEPAHPQLVSAELQRRGQLERVGGPAEIGRLLTAAPTPAAGQHHALIVKERAVLRRLGEAGVRITQASYTGHGDLDEIVANAAAEIAAVVEGAAVNDEDDFVTPGDAMEETLEAIDKAQKASGISGLSTGFADLDSLTNGLQPGQLIVIAARPAMGKSTLAMDFARAASVKHQVPTAFISLEMPVTELNMRLLSAEARVPLHHLRSGGMTEDSWTRLARRVPDVSEAPLFINDSASTFEAIQSKVRRLKARNPNLGLVIIDYLQLITIASKRPENRQQEVSDISRRLKLLAKELQLPIIALAQLNRGPEMRADKKPVVSDLRESGAIEQDADLVILLYRDDAYEVESPRAGEADIIVGKHRNGPTATITVAFQGHYSRFVDMAQT
ncbi:replicative DNA helicase [Streptomyces sp. NPDC058700]|uniref:replicative DNA helicase n=1 Tax=Streptomyces sp. NPDC058700 TaxID=3346607 RepID=UPI003664EBD4